jgi:translation initiation factor 2 beta subunit (eIF-2beta)/eIF-5
MRHTIEEKRKMRNDRKKRKRLQKTNLKRATLIKNALCDIRAEANQQRDVASKYYKLWKRTVDMNKKLRTIVNQREIKKKVNQSFSIHIQYYLY